MKITKVLSFQTSDRRLFDTKESAMVWEISQLILPELPQAEFRTLEEGKIWKSFAAHWEEILQIMLDAKEL